MKSRAMVLERFNQPLVEHTFDVPVLEEGELLVRIDASGVCGSDVHMWHGEDPRLRLPMILGHEGVGTIVDMQGTHLSVDGVPLKPGDHIIWNRGVTCGSCWYCQVAREPLLCVNRAVYGINISCDDPRRLTGCYAEDIVLRAGTDVFHMPSDVDPAVLVASCCSGATVAHAFDVVDESLIGGTVIVQGPGPLGLFAIALARRSGASQIIVIGGSPERLALCRKFGADVVINRRETTPEDRRNLIFDLTGGRGADIVVEAAGTRGAAEEGVRLLRRGGRYLLTGYAQPVGTDSIDFYRDVVFRNVTINGIWVSDTRHLMQAVELVMGDLDLFAGLVTHRFPLEQAQDALGVMDSHKALKAVLLPHGG